MLCCAEESTDAGLASKGNEVGTATVGFIEVPVLMGPHLSGLAESSSSFVNNEGNTFFLANCSHFLVKHRGGLLVLVCCYGLNNYSSDVCSLVTSLFNNLFESV